MLSDATGGRSTAAPLPSSFALLCWLAALLWMLAATTGGVVFALVAVTAAGRCAALASVAAGWGPFLLAKAWVDRAPRWRAVGWASAALALAIVGVLAARAPDGVALPGSRVHRHVPPGQGLSRFTPGNLVPEVDQLMAAYSVAVFTDRLFTSRQARELKALTRELYTELEADPDFARLPSMLPGVYGDVLGGVREPGPVFVYVPPGVDRTKPAPVLVFFHGSGGNFKAYLWILAKVADRCGMVVAAPSYGMGNWRMPATERAFEAALAATRERIPLADDDIHVAGLSNGGLAVSQLACSRGRQLRSVVFLSPVFDGPSLGSPDFARNCAGKPVLVFTGRDDDRVPPDYVRSAVDVLRAQAVDPVLEIVPQANHFLLFSHRGQVTGRLAAWFKPERSAVP